MASADTVRSSGSPTGQRGTRQPAQWARDPVRERRLLQAAQRGDRDAVARLIDAQLGLVRAIAWRYRDYGLSFEDLVQEGSIALLEAIERYDVDKSPEFDDYARFRVRRAIRNALTNQARLIRLPKHVVERRRALDRAEATLLATGGRPTPHELAAATGLSVAAVLEARSATQPPVSLDEPALPDGSPLVTLARDPASGDPAEETVEHEQRVRLRRAVARLPERQRKVVTAQWGLDGADVTSATQLARELKLSPRRTQTIGRDALHSLRSALELAEGAA